MARGVASAGAFIIIENSCHLSDWDHIRIGSSSNEDRAVWANLFRILPTILRSSLTVLHMRPRQYAAATRLENVPNGRSTPSSFCASRSSSTMKLASMTASKSSRNAPPTRAIARSSTSPRSLNIAWNSRNASWRRPTLLASSIANWRLALRSRTFFSGEIGAGFSSPSLPLRRRRSSRFSSPSAVARPALREPEGLRRAHQQAGPLLGRRVAQQLQDLADQLGSDHRRPLDPRLLDRQHRRGLAADVEAEHLLGGFHRQPPRRILAPLAQPQARQLHGGHRLAVRLAGFAQPQAHLLESALGAPEIAEPGIDLCLQPAQLDAVLAAGVLLVETEMTPDQRSGLAAAAPFHQAASRVVDGRQHQRAVLPRIDHLEPLGEQLDRLLLAPGAGGVQPLLDQAAAHQVRIAVAAVDPQRPIEERQRGGELAAVAVDIGFHLEQPGPEQAV